MERDVSLIVDGQDHVLRADPDMPLLYALRDELGLDNPRFGCGLGQCGACTVHLDGAAIRSCVTPVAAAEGRPVITLAGLGTPERPHPIQSAYIAEEVMQCGTCINGWIMTGAAFLRDNPRASDAEIREALTGLKCRCGTHVAILRAMRRAADGMAAAGTAGSAG